MTAELSRLAQDMLPQEEEEVHDKKARRLKQKGQDSKDLRQRLLDSWDGKVSLATSLQTCSTICLVSTKKPVAENIA